MTIPDADRGSYLMAMKPTTYEYIIDIPPEWRIGGTVLPGEAFPLAILRCNSCGCLVPANDEFTHTQWHAKLMESFMLVITKGKGLT
jgi:hypothetical protein